MKREAPLGLMAYFKLRRDLQQTQYDCRDIIVLNL